METQHQEPQRDVPQPFRNFLRGMETEGGRGFLLREDDFRNFLRGMETQVELLAQQP